MSDDDDEFTADDISNTDSQPIFDPEELDLVENLFKYTLHYCKKTSFKTIADTAFCRKTGNALFPKKSLKFKKGQEIFHNSKRRNKPPPPPTFDPLDFVNKTSWILDVPGQIQTLTPNRNHAAKTSASTPQRSAARPSRNTMAPTISNDEFQLFIKDEAVKNPVGVFCHKMYQVMGEDEATLHDMLQVDIGLHSARMAEFVTGKLSSDGSCLIVTMPNLPCYMLEEDFIDAFVDNCSKNPARENIFRATQAFFKSQEINDIPLSKTITYHLLPGETYNNSAFNTDADKKSPADAFTLVAKPTAHTHYMGETTEEDVEPTATSDGDYEMKGNGKYHKVESYSFNAVVTFELAVDSTDSNTKKKKKTGMSLEETFMKQASISRRKGRN